MAENLKNTILIENEEYNINAVYSDEAGKVTTPLVIKESGEEVGKYYGSTDTSETTRSEINYVPATGGTFAGPVQININNTSVEGVGDYEIINRGQMETVISKLDGAPLYTWDVSDGYNAVVNPENVPYKLNTVIGLVDDLPIFEAYTEGKAHNKYITPDNADINHVSYDTTKSTGYVVAYFTPAYNNEKDTITKLVIPGTYSSGNITNRPIKIDELNENITAFQDLTALETVHINPGVTEIGQAAFKGCTAMTSIAIPDSVSSIGKWAFENCTSLTSIILGSKITNIQESTFKNSGLKSVFIGSNVKTIHSNAFLWCDSLEKIYFAGTEEAWDSITGYVKDISVDFKNLKVTKKDETQKTVPVICIDDVHHPAAPFLYICKGVSSEDTSLTSNKMFLKLPGQALVEVSKGAARLERWDSKPSNNTDYFTYDVLAAVIAAINNRITALAGQKLALPTTLNVSGIEHTAVPELSDDIIPADESPILVPEVIVPTVQQLQEQITKLTGISYTDVNVPANFVDAYYLGYDFSRKRIKFTNIVGVDVNPPDRYECRIMFSSGSYLYYNSQYGNFYSWSALSGYGNGGVIKASGSTSRTFLDVGTITEFLLKRYTEYGEIVEDYHSITAEEFSKWVCIDFQLTPTEYSDTVLQAKADEDGNEIKSSYYQTEKSDASGARMNTGNSIRIKNFIPSANRSDSNYLEGIEGDICIVITN